METEEAMETMEAMIPEERIAYWPTVRQGDKGANVSAVQCLLNYHGASLTVDGSFGTSTYNAVVAFQNNKSITGDTSGVVGSNTFPSLVVQVQNGSYNEAGRAAQYLLNKFEYITIDGKFGSNSAKIAGIFRVKVGFTESSGIVTSTIWRYLFGYQMYPIDVSGTPYASVCTTNSTLTTTQMNSNAEYIYKYLTGQGFTKQAACGVLGNMQAESGINPGIWQSTNNTGLGYGLVQWSPGTRFIEWAVDAGLITSATASAVNGLTNSNAATLMKAELNFLTWDCSNSRVFYAPSGGDSTGNSMTFDQYKASTLSAATLARVFHDHYERSGASTLDQRAANATTWYNKL